MMSEKRFEYDRCTGIKDLSIDEDDDQFLYPTQIVEILNEQQSIIRRDEISIQTMMSNMKKLEEENEQLREVNKEISDDLHNCRLNKNIIREKLKLWQEVHKEYNIYSIKNFEELLNEQEQKIQRWKTLYEIKDKEVTARVKRLNEICNQYKHTITFDKDIDPNDAVNILCDRILQTEVEM